MKHSPKKSILACEREYRQKGYRLVIGIDEAGRGPLAGPVVAAALAILDLDGRDAPLKQLLCEVDDSKKLLPAKREALFGLMSRSPAVAFASAAVSAKVIDRVNILEATKIAMARAASRLVRALKTRKAARRIFCVLDGNFPANLPYDQVSVVAADQKIFSVAAASIVAKVRRDRMMQKFDKKYPGWGFSVHKGYPTRRHLAALAAARPSAIHRMSFKPCAAVRKPVARHCSNEL